MNISEKHQFTLILGHEEINEGNWTPGCCSRWKTFARRWLEGWVRSEAVKEV